MQKPDNITHEATFTDANRTEWTIYVYERYPLRSASHMPDEVEDQYRRGEIDDIPISERKFYLYVDEHDLVKVDCVCVLDDNDDLAYHVGARYNQKGWSEGWEYVPHGDVKSVAEAFIDGWAEGKADDMRPRDAWENGVKEAQNVL